MEVFIEQIVPERLLSWRWHPAAIDTAVNYSLEPMTLMMFELEETAGGVSLRVKSLQSSAPIFAALGDEMRLQLIAALCVGGAMSITQLTSGTDITRQAIT